MIADNRLILIGAAARNSGKTACAVKIIAYFAARTPITALKVTGVDAIGAACPRHSSCGACSLATEYSLNHEKNPPAGKDTALLLAAGAADVWWLRSLRGSLEAGYRDFCARIGADPRGAAPPAPAVEVEVAAAHRLVIAESNSLRRAVKPALFIMLHDSGTPAKPSASEVLPYADIILPSKPDAAGIARALSAIEAALKE